MRLIDHGNALAAGAARVNATGSTVGKPLHCLLELKADVAVCAGAKVHEGFAHVFFPCLFLWAVSEWVSDERVFRGFKKV